MELTTRQVLELVAVERKRQNAKWQHQEHDVYEWLAILTEEVGELARAILQVTDPQASVTALIKEAVQVAAVAIAIAEDMATLVDFDAELMTMLRDLDVSFTPLADDANS